jgi:putative transposase
MRKTRERRRENLRLVTIEVPLNAYEAAKRGEIHAGEDIGAARQKAVQVIDKLRGLRLTKAAELVEAGVEETLAYYAFPEEHWRRVRTNNPLERILREIRRPHRRLSAHSRTGNLLSISWRPGCAISPAPLGRPNVI